MSEKSALWTSVNYADACHINGKLTSIENEDMFALVDIIRQALQLINGVVGAAQSSAGCATRAEPKPKYRYLHYFAENIPKYTLWIKWLLIGKCSK